MSEENFNTAEKIKIFKKYGSYGDELCYAARRVEKIGAIPYDGFNNGLPKYIFKRAINQSIESKKMVAVYLNSDEIKGLFLAAPDYDAEDINYWWDGFVKGQYGKRWDKPIEEQKKEEEFDRFENYEYREALYKNWHVLSNEGFYAAERLEKLGVKPYSGRHDGTDFDIFKKALSEATEKGHKVGVAINSGRLQGLFVVSPDNAHKDDVETTFNHLLDNQTKLRWDKPILQQKAEEKMMTDNLTNVRK